MQLSGRSYIFVAATLLLLAGALKFYDDYAQTPAGQARVYAVKTAFCDWASVDAINLRIGCQSSLISAPSGGAAILAGGGGSTLRMGE